jgi:hypothetical protein
MTANGNRDRAAQKKPDNKDRPPPTGPERPQEKKSRQTKCDNKECGKWEESAKVANGDLMISSLSRGAMMASPPGGTTEATRNPRAANFISLKA